MDDVLKEKHAPLNMRTAYKQLQALYGESNIPLVLGSEDHGGRTDSVQIEVGIDQMMLCLEENYHEVPPQYRDSSPFFVLAHEFGHIVAHPGRDAVYWVEGAKELPVEHHQRFRWMNCISDILVNWTVITATAVLDKNQKQAIQKQMTDGWRASQFVRRCNTREGFARHKRLLAEGKLKDNRYKPPQGLRGQYDEHAQGDPYTPTPETPLYQKHMGHGRGEQYYPPINYAVAKKMADKWRTVVMVKDVMGFKKGQKYVVEGTKTYDGRTNTEGFEPIKEFQIGGQWVGTRYCQPACPDCGAPANTIWDNWWQYTTKEQKEAEIKTYGTWRYLLIQMFAFEWAMAYSSVIKYGNNPLNRDTGKQFLSDIASDMDAAMRSR